MGGSNCTRVGTWKPLPNTIASPEASMVTWSKSHRAWIGITNLFDVGWQDPDQPFGD